MKKTVFIAITAMLLAAALCACNTGPPPDVTTEPDTKPETVPAISANPILVWDYVADQYDQALAQQATLYAILAYDQPDERASQ